MVLRRKRKKLSNGIAGQQSKGIQMLNII